MLFPEMRLRQDENISSVTEVSQHKTSLKQTMFTPMVRSCIFLDAQGHQATFPQNITHIVFKIPLFSNGLTTLRLSLFEDALIELKSLFSSHSPHTSVAFGHGCSGGRAAK